MNLYKVLSVLMVAIMLVTGCQFNEGEEMDGKQLSEDTKVEKDLVDEDGSITLPVEVESPEMDREAITNAIYTIPRVDGFGTGYKVISADESVLINGDFLQGQNAWQINTIDGVVFDKGLWIQKQTALMQQVILAQRISGFEKMKSYLVSVEAVVTGDVPLTIKIRNAEDGTIYASAEIILTDEKVNYQAEFAMNFDLQEAVVFEVTFHTDNNDLVHIKDIALTRKPGTIVWSDEFEVDGLPDSEKWAYDVGGSGWGNAERQYYMANDLDNTYVKEGVLTIQSLIEEVGSNPYTSARMVTRGTFESKYKRIEIRAKLPSGIGTWPALWMLSANRVYGTWPASGEIDIMEHVGYDPDIVHGTIHTSTYNHTKNTQKAGLIYVPESSEEFHDYTIDWTPYEIDFYVDDYLYFTYDNDGSGSSSWPYDQDFYLIMCLAIGGGWGGQQGIDEAALPAKMEVDYVRVYDIPLESIDIEAPSTVSDIDIQVNGTLATIYWERATDDYLVDHYDIYLDDQLITSTKELDYTFYQLKASSSYSVGIVAVDEEGNESEFVTQGFFTETSQGQSIGGIIEGESSLISVGGVLKETEDRTFVDYLDDGDYLVYEVMVETTGNYTLDLSYSSLMSKGIVSIAVDGLTLIQTYELEANGGWDTFKEVTLGQLYLEKGRHFITVFTEKSGFAVDYINFK